jgi:integrase
MGKKKGSGTVVQIKGRYYPRWTVNGARVYGSPFDSWSNADSSRVNDIPGEAKPINKRDVPSLGEWAKSRMRGDYGRKIAVSTFGKNESIRGRHLEGSNLGNTKLHRITIQLCRSFLDGMRKANGERVGPAHRNSAQIYLSSLFSQAVEAGLIKVNPMKGVKLAEVEERENRTLAPEEAVLLLNPSTMVDAIMLVAMHTGMRKGELIRLEWRHIGTDTIKIPGTKSVRAKAALPLTKEARDAILAQPKKSIFVFTGEDGGPVKPRKLADQIHERKAALGLPKETRLQDLRGSYVSLLIERGVDVRTVMELARHADLRTTMKSYARSRQATQKAAVEKLREAITVTEIPGKKSIG